MTARLTRPPRVTRADIEFDLAGWQASGAPTCGHIDVVDRTLRFPSADLASAVRLCHQFNRLAAAGIGSPCKIEMKVTT